MDKKIYFAPMFLILALISAVSCGGDSGSNIGLNPASCDFDLRSITNGANPTQSATHWECQENLNGNLIDEDIKLYADGTGEFKADEAGIYTTFIWSQTGCRSFIIQIPGIKTSEVTDIQGSFSSGIFNFKDSDGANTACRLLQD